jgi:multidrug resistance efflux pump
VAAGNQARGRPLLDDDTRETMAERSDWKEMLLEPLPPPDDVIDNWMKPQRERHEPGSSTAGRGASFCRARAVDRDARQRNADRVDRRPDLDRWQSALVLCRRSPDSLHRAGRVQAFVVPVAAEVAGKVLTVHVRNNEDVQRGMPLFDIDPGQYQIALQRARSDYESVRRSVNAGGGGGSDGAGVVAGGAGQSSQGRHGCDEAGASVCGRPRRDLGAPPGECAGDQGAGAQSGKGRRGRADAGRRKPRGESGDDNAQLRSARSAIEKAELDLLRTRVLAPANGRVTDLRTDVGYFAQAGAPAMTLIAMHDLWISAEMTENNLGHIERGDVVAIVLDFMPGEVLQGRVRSVGSGVSSGQQAPPGTLPTIQNSRDWLRQAQRFPVAIEFDASEAERLRKVRIGGQAEVMVYTGANVADEPARRRLHPADEPALLPLLSANDRAGRQGGTAAGGRPRPRRSGRLRLRAADAPRGLPHGHDGVVQAGSADPAAQGGGLCPAARRPAA